MLILPFTRQFGSHVLRDIADPSHCEGCHMVREIYCEGCHMVREKYCEGCHVIRKKNCEGCHVVREKYCEGCHVVRSANHMTCLANSRRGVPPSASEWGGVPSQNSKKELCFCF